LFLKIQLFFQENSIMKLFTIKYIAAAACLTALSGIFSGVFAATSVKAKVNGMVCAFCAQGIEKRLSKLPATLSVFVDLKQRVVAVEAKDGQTLDAKQVAAEIVDAGYDVVKIETVAQSVEQIKSQTLIEAKAKK
jgi:copper chaperone CopZ